jgi:hypothetical protein
LRKRVSRINDTLMHLTSDTADMLTTTTKLGLLLLGATSLLETPFYASDDCADKVFNEFIVLRVIGELDFSEMFSFMNIDAFSHVRVPIIFDLLEVFQLLLQLQPRGFILRRDLYKCCDGDLNDLPSIPGGPALRVMISQIVA